MATCKNCSQQEKSDKKIFRLFLNKITVNICISHFENNSEFKKRLNDIPISGVKH